MSINRLNDILDLLKEKGTISIVDLAALLYVSTSTIRRDLKALEKQNMVLLEYGTVSLRLYNNTTLNIETRHQIQLKEKRIIGKKAADLVHNGDILLLDTSTTVQNILPFLLDKKDLTIITNSIRICSLLTGSNFRVFSTGGLLYNHCEGLCGGFTEESLRHFHVDWLFFSSKGISNCGAISDDSEMETYARRTMLKAAKKKVYLCDDSKIGKQYVYQVCHKKDVDMILSNIPLPESLK